MWGFFLNKPTDLSLRGQNTREYRAHASLRQGKLQLHLSCHTAAFKSTVPSPPSLAPHRPTTWGKADNPKHHMRQGGTSPAQDLLPAQGAAQWVHTLTTVTSPLLLYPAGHTSTFSFPTTPPSVPHRPRLSQQLSLRTLSWHWGGGGSTTGRNLGSSSATLLDSYVVNHRKRASGQRAWPLRQALARVTWAPPRGKGVGRRPPARTGPSPRSCPRRGGRGRRRLEGQLETAG